MRMRRSWVLSVLPIIALVIAAHDVRAQSYPYTGPGVAPAGMAGPEGAYLGQSGPASPAPGIGQPPAGAYGMMPPGMGGMPPQGFGPGMPMGPGMAPGMPPGMPPGYGPGPYGYQPAAYYDPTQGAAPQPLAPMPATPMQGMPMEGMPMQGMPMQGMPMQGMPMNGMPMQGMPMQGMPMNGMPMDGYYGEGEGYCGNCGGQGCKACMLRDDFDLHLLHWLLPYGAGGCCAQRWYDINVDAVYLQRDNTADSYFFESDGIDGPRLLGTDDLSLDESAGVRVSAAMQLGAGNVLEATYLGSFNWSDQTSVVSPTNNLFSVMSNFGQDPFGGFDDTDEAAYAALEYSSNFDSVELNYRQRWVAPNCKIQGSWLAGARYFYLTEEFRYATVSFARNGAMDYDIGVSNSLTGAQLGGDLWVCIMPGLSIGGELKGGIYGNRATQRTHIDAVSFGTPVDEKVTGASAAFLGDAKVTVLWRLSQNWTLRGGYMFVYVDQVALAAENFNPAPPFVNDPLRPRIPRIADNSDVFYHGAHFGLEYMW